MGELLCAHLCLPVNFSIRLHLSRQRNAQFHPCFIIGARLVGVQCHYLRRTAKSQPPLPVSIPAGAHWLGSGGATVTLFFVAIDVEIIAT